MARAIGSWLSGPEPSDFGDPAARTTTYPGEQLGLPPNGPGSIARFGRRVAALCVDWLLSYGLAALAMTLGLVDLAALSTAVPVIWIVLGAISVRLFGFTTGQLAFGLQVAAVDGREHVGIARALVRGLLVFLVIPALFTDSDLRGLQDLATKTAVVRR